MRFVATINVPGYSPMDDDPPTFEKAQDAWAYLASERERGEEFNETENGFTDTFHKLTDLAEADWDERVPAALAMDGTGVVYGGTPGYDGEHDLGLAYSVNLVDETDEPDDMQAEQRVRY